MCPSPFYAKTHAATAQTTTLLKKRPALWSISALAPDFGTFAHLGEVLSAVCSGFSEVEGDDRELRQDTQALLLRVRSDREVWCSEEGERNDLRLFELCHEVVKVESERTRLEEDMRAVDMFLDRMRGSYRQRQRLLDAFRMDSELLLSSLSTGGENQRRVINLKLSCVLGFTDVLSPISTRSKG